MKIKPIVASKAKVVAKFLVLERETIKMLKARPKIIGNNPTRDGIIRKKIAWYDPESFFGIKRVKIAEPKPIIDIAIKIVLYFRANSSLVNWEIVIGIIKTKTNTAAPWAKNISTANSAERNSVEITPAIKMPKKKNKKISQQQNK